MPVPQSSRRHILLVVQENWTGDPRLAEELGCAPDEVCDALVSRLSRWCDVTCTDTAGLENSLDRKSHRRVDAVLVVAGAFGPGVRGVVRWLAKLKPEFTGIITNMSVRDLAGVVMVAEVIRCPMAAWIGGFDHLDPLLRTLETFDSGETNASQDGAFVLLRAIRDIWEDEGSGADGVEGEESRSEVAASLALGIGFASRGLPFETWLDAMGLLGLSALTLKSRLEGAGLRLPVETDVDGESATVRALYTLMQEGVRCWSGRQRDPRGAGARFWEIRYVLAHARYRFADAGNRSMPPSPPRPAPKVDRGSPVAQHVWDALRSGEPSAGDTFWRLFYDELVDQARRLIPGGRGGTESEVTAEDVAELVLSDVIRRGEALPSIGDPGAYLRSAVHKAALRLFRGLTEKERLDSRADTDGRPTIDIHSPEDPESDFAFSDSTPPSRGSLRGFRPARPWSIGSSSSRVIRTRKPQPWRESA